MDGLGVRVRRRRSTLAVAVTTVRSIAVPDDADMKDASPAIRGGGIIWLRDYGVP
jgi:hypothetical protein